jgi:hypothetical protein
VAVSQAKEGTMRLCSKLVVLVAMAAVVGLGVGCADEAGVEGIDVAAQGGEEAALQETEAAIPEIELTLEDSGVAIEETAAALDETEGEEE